MAGGTWTSQNKIRPGVYIRFKNGVGVGLTVGDRGIVAICEPMSWGPVGQVLTVEAGADLTPVTGYDATSVNNRFLTEIFKGSNRTACPSKVLLYRPAATGSASATATIGSLTATARYPGVRGNDIFILVSAVVDSPDTYTVSTVVDGVLEDEQTVSTVEALTANDWVDFSGTGTPEATTGVPLTGGVDGTVNPYAYSDFLSVIEGYDFDILIYDGTDTTVQAAMVTFIKRIAEENGQYAQLVAAGLTNPDSPHVIHVGSGVQLSDGTVLNPAQTTWWVGGAQAGALYNQSLTCASYPGAMAVSPVMTNSEYEKALSTGMFVLFAENGTVKVEQDINSLTTFTADMGKAFRKNRTMRLCATIANDIYQQFSDNFLGAVNNNEQGRTLLKGAIVGYLLEIQASEGIQNFTADDVEVLPGTDSDAVLVNAAIQPVDSVEKIYLSVSLS